MFTLNPGQIRTDFEPGYIEFGALEDYADLIFIKVKNIRLDRLSATPVFHTPQIFSVEHEGRRLSLYWGDLHCHSNISICSRHPSFHCTEVNEKHRFSRDVGGLDFMMLTDHEYMSPFDWYKTKKYAQLSNADGSFASFEGFEWSCTQQKGFHNYGHYNVLYKDSGELLPISDEGCRTTGQLWARLKNNEALTIPHHPGDFDHPLDWERFDPEYAPVVEIYQVRGSYEDELCEMQPQQFGRKQTPGRSVKTGLAMGYRFGFTGGGEHEGVGLTGIYSPELTREAIYEALRKRNVYATTSARITLFFRLGGVLMGGELPVPPGGMETRYEIIAECTGDIEYIALVGPDDTYYIPGYSGERTINATANIFIKPGYLYVRIKQADGNIAWGSPVFIIGLGEGSRY